MNNNLILLLRWEKSIISGWLEGERQLVGERN
jgi:hypothetical protein